MSNTLKSTINKLKHVEHTKINNKQTVKHVEHTKINNKQTYKTQDENKQSKCTTQCVGHHYMQTNTNTVNKTLALLLTMLTGAKTDRTSLLYSDI
jgi:hypothetical protein